MRLIASGGIWRISRKLEMRWPLSRMIGLPSPRPRPLPVCGAMASISSSIEEAP